MKKVLLTAALVFVAAGSSAQAPGGGMPPMGGGMFGGMPDVEVTFNEYVAAPKGFDQVREGIEHGKVQLIEYKS